MHREIRSYPVGQGNEWIRFIIISFMKFAVATAIHARECMNNDSFTNAQGPFFFKMKKWNRNVFFIKHYQ
jgi:hypothetical protein